MSVDIIPRKYNEEEQEFIRKYGESSFLIWETLSDSQKSDYYELEQLYSDFFELYRDHYDDLKLYALMYRNVPLYNITNDVFSVSFFCTHKKEIIGFTKRVATEKSLKAQILKLYSQNEALFPKICIKYIDINFQKNRKTSDCWCHIFDILRKIKDGTIENVLSVNDLTDDQCAVLLKHEKDLAKEYHSLHEEYLGEHGIYEWFNNTENELNFYIAHYLPFMRNGIRYMMINEYIRKGIIDYIKKEGKANDYESETIKVNKELSEIASLKGKISDQIREVDELTIVKNDMVSPGCFYPHRLNHNYEKIKEKYALRYKMIENHLFWSNRNGYSSINSASENEFYNKMFWDSVENLENEVKKIEEEIKAKKGEKKWLEIELKGTESGVFHKVTDYTCFKLMFWHQEEINKHLTIFLEKEYNQMWLDTPQKIKEMEREKSNYPSIFTILMNISSYGRTAIFRKIRNRATNEYAYKYYPNYLMWHFLTKFRNEILEEKEKQRKEEEERARIEAEKKKQEEERRRREEERKLREEEARREKYRYNQRNSHWRDRNIIFNEARHTYTIGGSILQSVTNIVENCFPKFDAELHAKNTAAKMGITPKEVIAMWEQKGKESRELGTAMHQKIESYYQGKDSWDDDSYKLFKIFADKVKLEPYRTEWAVYDTDYNIAGTIDFVDYQDGKYTIYDWKRSDKIIANGMPVKVSKYQEKGLYPLEHLENCAYYHYALQLSLYKFILEKNYDIKVSDLRLGIFHPSYDKPYVLKMPYLENEVKTLMELRSEVIF